jgi:subfamily B ATP-binding cassette protein MsbA
MFFIMPPLNISAYVQILTDWAVTRARSGRTTNSYSLLNFTAKQETYRFLSCKRGGFSDKVRVMTMTNSQLYLRLLSYVKPYWRTFLLSIIATAVTAATEPLLPALLKPMLDGTFVNRDEAVVRLVPIFILLIFLVRGVASFVSSYAIGWVGDKVVMDLRNEMFRKLMTLHTRYYDDHATGQLISKFTFDVTRVTDAATNVVTVTIRDSIIIIGLMGWLLYLNWKLTMITLVMMPVIAIVIRVINLRMRSSSRDSMRAMGDMKAIDSAIVPTGCADTR